MFVTNSVLFCVSRVSADVIWDYIYIQNDIKIALK